MKSRIACLAGALFFLQPLAAQYRTALPGYRFEFPRDHFSHPDFQTEWWYYTGNVKSGDGHRFGFELTFFRQAVNRDPAKTAVWEVKDLYLAHLALSDLDDREFFHSERTNRSGPGIAGVSQSIGRIWNGNWQIQWDSGDQKLRAIDERFELHLTLHSEKPPVIHGENGVSQKAEGPGRASHYISLTRLDTSGSIELGGKKFEVTGFSWMDHEFFTHELDASQIGWDWLSLQFADNTELMLFRIRRNDGSSDPHSAGTYIDARGKATHLRRSDFTLQPHEEKWTSPATRARYPIHWKIAVPTLGLELEVKTPLASQELTGKTKLVPNYWEGAIVLTGYGNTQRLSGVGYLEMTGYDRPIQLAR
jgi:predicted secreted hydrolase